MPVSRIAERLGAVVVNLDAGDALLDCVASLRRAGVEEIVVVDNASSDGSLVRLAEVDRSVRILPTGRNLGYGTAANRGAALHTSEYLLVCNPDLVVDDAAPALLVAALDADHELAVVGPSITGSDGALYPSARMFPSLVDAAGHALLGLFRADNPFSRRYRRDEVVTDDATQVDWLSGACAAFRRDAFTSVGGFDERYFMYVEDLDLCWRLKRAGWRAGYVPAAHVVHAQGVSARHHPYRMLVAHHRSTLRFARRSQTGARQLFVPLAALLLAVRLVAAVATELARSLAVRPRPRERTVG